MTDIADLQKQIDGLKANYDESLDTIWMLLAGMLVFFMHAGFTMLEVSHPVVGVGSDTGRLAAGRWLSFAMQRGCWLTAHAWGVGCRVLGKSSVEMALACGPIIDCRHKAGGARGRFHVRVWPFAYITTEAAQRRTSSLSFHPLSRVTGGLGVHVQHAQHFVQEHRQPDDRR